MNLRSMIIAFLLMGGFLAAECDKLRAAESWAVDPKTGARIGWVAEDQMLINANWSGPQVRRMAQGKGVLTFTVRLSSGKEERGQADAEMLAGMLDGKVSLKWSNGNSFEGSYKAGLREGRGITRFPNGTVLDYDWKNGKWDGKGIAKYGNGDSFEGELKNNSFNGTGVYKWADGTIHKGEFKDGRPDGIGARTWPNGNFYEGDFKKGARTGKGRMKYFNGATYEGDFVNYRPSGKGVLKDPRGAVIFAGERKDLRDDSMQQFYEAAAPDSVSAPFASAASPATAPATALAPPTLLAPAPRTQATAPEASVSSYSALLRELRERLYELNFDPAAGDAPLVEADRRAIREFEEKNNLPQTGEPTVTLLNNLRGAVAHSPWGAIVFAKSSGKWGMAWGHASRKEAVASAVSTCGDVRQCTVELSFFGTECGAFAYSGTTWALTARANADKAKEAALADCQKGGHSCSIVATVCASGSDRRQADKQE